MKKIHKILLLILITFCLITCTKKDRTLYLKSKEFKNLLGRWELQSILCNGKDSTKQFMADTNLADGWVFDFIINNKKTEGYFLAYNTYMKAERITKYGTNCWYLSKNNTQLIIKFILNKSEYEKLWQQNNKEIIFDIIYLNKYIMILKLNDLNNKIYELNFIKRGD